MRPQTSQVAVYMFVQNVITSSFYPIRKRFQQQVNVLTPAYLFLNMNTLTKDGEQTFPSAKTVGLKGYERTKSFCSSSSETLLGFSFESQCVYMS